MVKANPDKAQLPVRLRALQEGKRVYMAVPRMRSIKPFVLVDPHRLSGSIEDAVTSDGAVRHKGGGFSDLEIALA